MKITRIKKTIESYRTTCKRCKKHIFATSEKLLKHNFGVHDYYCKKKDAKTKKEDKK